MDVTVKSEDKELTLSGIGPSTVLGLVGDIFTGHSYENIRPVKQIIINPDAPAPQDDDPEDANVPA